MQRDQRSLRSALIETLVPSQEEDTAETHPLSPNGYTRTWVQAIHQRLIEIGTVFSTW